MKILRVYYCQGCGWSTVIDLRDIPTLACKRCGGFHFASQPPDKPAHSLSEARRLAIQRKPDPNPH